MPVEPLESRALLAATVMVIGHRLTVYTDDVGTSVHVTVFRNGTLAHNNGKNLLDVEVDGVAPVIEEQHSNGKFLPHTGPLQEKNIRKMWFVGGAGNDDFEIIESPLNIKNPRDDIQRFFTGGVTMYGGGGNDTLVSGHGQDVLIGGAGDDHIEGGYGSDVIFGGSGNDTLFGGPGENLVFGQDGNDTIIGGGNHDALYGGAGDDSLSSGGNRDFLYGGGGNNVLDGGGEAIVAIQGDPPHAAAYFDRIVQLRLGLAFRPDVLT